MIKTILEMNFLNWCPFVITYLIHYLRTFYFSSLVHIYLFSHTQRVSVTLAITLCPSSSLSSSSLSSAWTFLVFRPLLSNRCTDLLQILCGCSLGGPLLSLSKSGCYPYISWNNGIILCNFWPILKKSSIKPLTRNHSYLAWRVPSGSCF